MTKFIQTIDGDFVHLDFIRGIIAVDNMIQIATGNGTADLYKAESNDEAKDLAMEFCLLVSSHPAGVFIFIKEDLLKQKALRAEQQAAKEPKLVEKKKEARKK